MGTSQTSNIYGCRVPESTKPRSRSGFHAPPGPQPSPLLLLSSSSSSITTTMFRTLSCAEGRTHVVHDADPTSPLMRQNPGVWVLITHDREVGETTHPCECVALHMTQPDMHEVEKRNIVIYKKQLFTFEPFKLHVEFR